MGLRRATAFALCVLLPLAACVLWARSYVAGDAWTGRRDGQLIYYYSVDGAIGRSAFFLGLNSNRPAFRGDRPYEHRRIHVRPDAGGPAMNVNHYYRFAGAEYVDVPEGNGGRLGEWTMVLPWWLVALAANTFTFGAIVRGLRVRSRRRQGCCPVCGYDLRATPDRCPECGFEPAAG